MNLTVVKKRNGDFTAFDLNKIKQAIAKAGKVTDEFDLVQAEKMSLDVKNRLLLLEENKDLDVELIQDQVEQVLLESFYKKSAKTYILYRQQHKELRALVSAANSDMMQNYLQALDWRVRENSNMTFSLQGLNSYISTNVSETYWLNRVYPDSVSSAHQQGDFHIHDLGSLSVYCVGWDLYQLLKKGFCGVSGKVASKPPRHLSSALGQITNFFFTLQGEAAGAQAFSSLDTLLAPYIRYDNLSDEELLHELESFVFNLNVPTRVGFQTPFTNITLDLQPSPLFKDIPVIIAGEEMPECYADFQEEMNRFNKAFCQVMLQGDAQGRAFSFPIPTYNITPGFDWDNPNLDLLWEMTARYGIPYFANFINTDMKPEDARSMCCRLRLDNRELRKRGGGLFGANPLTGSIGVVTLNLPRLAYLSSNEEQFFESLEALMYTARISLELKRKLLEQLTDKGLYPYTAHYLSAMKHAQGRYWTNHFSTIGIVGMNEACLNLLGTSLASEEGQQFALKTLRFIRQLLVVYQEETGNLYNLEATPAEATAYRLALLDKKNFPDIWQAGYANEEGKRVPSYTNSSHLPVNYTDNPFTALNLQEQLQVLYTGGSVFHYFSPEAAASSMQVKRLVQKICSHYALPYITYTPNFSVCSEHGYLKGAQKKCPYCNQSTEVYSRVVGYLRPVAQWNEGKQTEFQNRKLYILPKQGNAPCAV